MSDNPANRFERIFYQPEPATDPTDPVQPAETAIYKDTSRSIIAYNESPDVGFDASLNPYRGCEHGCIYCYARPTHEYLGFSAGLDFETKIMVKEDAARILRQELAAPKWKPQVLAVSGVTDPYQPIERQLRITRGCLEVLAEFRNPIVIVTKNHLVTRDVDILSDLARYQAAAVFVSVTTLDSTLARRMEPRASAPQKRLDAIASLTQAGVPTGVMVAPILPGLTDHEIPSIIEASVTAGAAYAGHVLVRLPYGVKELFERWLEEHFPDRSEKVLKRIRAVRGGKLNDPRFGSRMHGEGIFAEQIDKLFRAACKKHGILGRRPDLATDSFRRPAGYQLGLFGS